MFNTTVQFEQALKALKRLFKHRSGLRVKVMKIKIWAWKAISVPLCLVSVLWFLLSTSFLEQCSIGRSEPAHMAVTTGYQWAPVHTARLHCARLGSSLVFSRRRRQKSGSNLDQGRSIPVKMDAFLSHILFTNAHVPYRKKTFTLCSWSLQLETALGMAIVKV